MFLISRAPVRNLRGRGGKQKCETCRERKKVVIAFFDLAHVKCRYDSATDPCKACQRRGLLCSGKFFPAEHRLLSQESRWFEIQLLSQDLEALTNSPRTRPNTLLAKIIETAQQQDEVQEQQEDEIDDTITERYSPLARSSNHRSSRPSR